MKKYLIICLILIALVFGGDYLYYYSGDLYLPHVGEVTCFTGSDSESLYLDTGSGLEVFEIKGVNLGLGKPGSFATEYAITKEEYLRWFRQIQDLGANVIRTYTIAHPDFYEAFYEYNVDNPDPLYLIHGVWVDDYLINSGYSAFDEEFYEPFLEECKDVVDVIHGRHKDGPGDNQILSSRYTKDISPWVYGYILGVEWESDLVVYTDECVPQAEQFEGEYLYTQNARNFEIFLAGIGDSTIAYETAKYGTQRSVAFSNWPTTCALDFSEKVRYANKNYGLVDVNHIRATDHFVGGMFASYHIYPYYPEYALYEEETADTENTYLYFLTKLNEHHNQPVVISEFGVPTSRGKAAYEQNRELGRDQGGINETKQGEALVTMYQDIMNSGSAGGIVFIWQDEWFKRTWNTCYAVDLNATCYWSDYQTNEQYFGLLSFDPGKEQSICYVDGDKSEWDREDVVAEQDGCRLSMKYDEKFIYFLAEKDGFNVGTERLCIPIDTTPKSGATTADNLGIRMSDPADFVLEINGTENSRLWVQERYNSITALYGGELKRYFNPFINIPDRDSGKFDRILMLLNESDYYFEDQQVDFWDWNSDYSDQYYALMQSYETGKLTYGNANPSADNFDSMADFCGGDGFVEIKLPWELLNFADPTKMRIHDDYYECYGVEYLSIDSIRVGVGNEKNTIQMAEFPMKKLGRTPEYHERLKESYYILQDFWVNGTLPEGLAGNTGDAISADPVGDTANTDDTENTGE